MEKHKPLGDKEKPSPPRRRDDRARPARQPEGRPTPPGERSDEEAIGRPVQLDEAPAKHGPRPSDELGSDDRGA